MQQQPLLIHVMHPDALVAAGIVALLENRAEFDIAPVMENVPGDAGIGVVVTDHAGGIDMARACAAAGVAGPRILIVTHLDKEAHVREALDLGVHGYLLQGCSADELREAARQLGKGLRYLTDQVARSIADSITRALLTRRESDVLHLLATGHCNKLIARELGIGVGTVKTHIKGLLTKLDAKARTHAVVIAAQRGLVDPGLYGALSTKTG